MRVVVQFHSQVQDELERWLAGDDDDPERRALVRIYVDELKRVLEQTAGQPPGAIRVGTTEPFTYRLRYTGEVEITYQVRARRERFLQPSSTRIIVTGIRPARAG